MAAVQVSVEDVFARCAISQLCLVRLLYYDNADAGEAKVEGQFRSYYTAAARGLLPAAALS